LKAADAQAAISWEISAAKEKGLMKSSDFIGP